MHEMFYLFIFFLIITSVDWTMFISFMMDWHKHYNTMPRRYRGVTFSGLNLKPQDLGRICQHENSEAINVRLGK